MFLFFSVRGSHLLWRVHRLPLRSPLLLFQNPKNKKIQTQTGMYSFTVITHIQQNHINPCECLRVSQLLLLCRYLPIFFDLFQFCNFNPYSQQLQAKRRQTLDVKNVNPVIYLGCLIWCLFYYFFNFSSLTCLYCLFLSPVLAKSRSI